MRNVPLVIGVCWLLAGCVEATPAAKAPVEDRCARMAAPGCPTQNSATSAERKTSDTYDDGRVRRTSALARVVAAYGESDAGDDLFPQLRPPVSASEPVFLALAAPVDPSRLTTESIAPLGHASRTACEVLAKPGVCVARQSGPIVVTDLVAMPGCAGELYLAATDTTGVVRWALPVTAAGTHGGRFFVRGDEVVTVAARGAVPGTPGDVRCTVTWSGFRPRIVPMMPGTNAAALAP